jgi:riboflavin transporter FmnP
VKYRDNGIIHILKFSVQKFCLISRCNSGFWLFTPSHNKWHCLHIIYSRTVSHMAYSSLVFHLISYCHNSNNFGFIFKTCSHIQGLTQNNFLPRLAQIRERGIQSRLYQELLSSNEPEEQPSTIDVSMVTVAQILVVLVAGYVTGIFVLLIERCLHGNILKYWPRLRVRRLRYIE